MILKSVLDIISGSSLSFEVDEKPAFVVPLKDVSQATTGESFLYYCVHHEHVILLYKLTQA